MKTQNWWVIALVINILSVCSAGGFIQIQFNIINKVLFCIMDDHRALIWLLWITFWSAGIHLFIFLVSFVIRQKKKKRRKRLWLERWRPPPTLTPPSSSSKERVRPESSLGNKGTTDHSSRQALCLYRTSLMDRCVCIYMYICVILYCHVSFLPARLPCQRDRQVPAGLHQQRIRELCRGVSGRFFPLPSGTWAPRGLGLRVDQVVGP